MLTIILKTIKNFMIISNQVALSKDLMSILLLTKFQKINNKILSSNRRRP